MKQVAERTCACCLSGLATTLQCGGCNARAYCSKQCQTQDWKQGHKRWCALRAGEEGVHWEVRYVSPEMGRGVFALRPLPEGFRIMVGHPPTTTSLWFC